MSAAKWHVLLTVLLTQALAYWKGNLPYFPIEVSRTAASDPLALNAFRIGILTLIFTLQTTEPYHTAKLFVWLALVCIAVFDDENYKMLHVVGLVMLGFGMAWLAALRKPYGWPILLTAAVIYGIRLVFKFGVLYWFEMDRLDFVGAGHLALAIMSKGQASCKHAPVVLPIFQICGVLQWCCFYALSELL